MLKSIALQQLTLQRRLWFSKNSSSLITPPIKNHPTIPYIRIFHTCNNTLNTFHINNLYATFGGIMMHIEAVWWTGWVFALLDGHQDNRFGFRDQEMTWCTKFNHNNVLQLAEESPRFKINGKVAKVFVLINKGFLLRAGFKVSHALLIGPILMDLPKRM